MTTPIRINAGIVDLSKKLPAILAVLITTLENHKLTGSEDIENEKKHTASMHLQTRVETIEIEIGIVVAIGVVVEIMRKEVGKEEQIKEEQIERQAEAEVEREAERETLETITLLKEDVLPEEKIKTIGNGLLLVVVVERRPRVSGRAHLLVVAVVVVGIVGMPLPLKQLVEVPLRVLLDSHSTFPSNGLVVM